MPDIKLFVACHQPTFVPNHPLLFPIQVGAALTSERFPGFLYDDTGDNISAKNRSYCELTAQYWAWKNIDADYYGFFHYRRYLYPDPTAPKPYRIAKAPSLQQLEALNFNQISAFIEQYDVIAPIAENMHVSVYQQYSTAPFHHSADLEAVENILRTQYPQMVPSMNEYLHGTKQYFGNIFIMRKDLFFYYCEWLFNTLKTFEQQYDFSFYEGASIRVFGYLAERLLGIWLTSHKSIRTLMLPRIHFETNDFTRSKKRFINIVFPPSSARRAFAKRIQNHFL